MLNDEMTKKFNPKKINFEGSYLIMKKKLNDNMITLQKVK